jgi:hypothetical protein
MRVKSNDVLDTTFFGAFCLSVQKVILFKIRVKLSTALPI